MSRCIGRSIFCLTVAIFIALPGLAQAVDEREPGAHRLQMRDGGLPVFDESGFRVFFDHSTARLRRPTREEIQRYGLTFAELFNVSGKGLVVKQDASGMLSVTLNEDYLDHVTASVAPDGRLLLSCFRGTRAAPASLSSTRPRTPAAEEK